MAAHDPRLLHYWAPGCQNSAQYNYAHGVLDRENKHISVSVWTCASSQEENYLQKDKNIQEKESLYKLIVK